MYQNIMFFKNSEVSFAYHNFNCRITSDYCAQGYNCLLFLRLIIYFCTDFVHLIIRSEIVNIKEMLFKIK